MLARDYPTYFDETEVKVKWTQWSVSKENVVNERETEAGTDDVDIVRSGKTSIQASAPVTARWAGFFEGKSSQKTIFVQYFDPANGQYAYKIMRMTGFSLELVENSDRVESTNGLYYVSFDLVEY